MAHAALHGVLQVDARPRRPIRRFGGRYVGRGAVGDRARSGSGAWGLEGMKFEGVSTIVTFEETPDTQAHREAAGAPMAMRLLRRIFDMRGRSVLLGNDCLPVIYALEKGSNSPQLQAAAEAVCREAFA